MLIKIDVENLMVLKVMVIWKSLLTTFKYSMIKRAFKINKSHNDT